jgi:hypothetical protein
MGRPMCPTRDAGDHRTNDRSFSHQLVRSGMLTIIRPSAMSCGRQAKPRLGTLLQGLILGHFSRHPENVRYRTKKDVSPQNRHYFTEVTKHRKCRRTGPGLEHRLQCWFER